MRGRTPPSGQASRSSRPLNFGSAETKLPARPIDYLLISLLMIAVWRFQDIFPILGSLQVPSIAFIAAMAVFVANGMTKTALVRMKTPIMGAAIFILCWMGVSVPGSVYPGLSGRFIAQDHIKTFAMMFMILGAIRNYWDVERFVLANLVGAGVYCITILKSFSVGNNGRLGDMGFYDANDLAMLVVCTLPLAVFFLRSGMKWWVRLAALGCCAVFTLAIVRSGSRGGFLGLIAVTAFLVVGFTAIPSRTRLLAVGGSAILLFNIAGPQYWTMMSSLLAPQDDYNWSGGDDVGRMEIWKRGMGYMADHAIAGVGANAFPTAEGKISFAALQAQGIGMKWSAAHNSFVQIGAELGVPGLVAFLVLLWRTFSAAWRVSRTKTRAGPTAQAERALAQTLIAALLGYVVAGFFLSQAYCAYLYVFLAMVTGLAIIVRDPITIKKLALSPRATAGLAGAGA